MVSRKWLSAFSLFFLSLTEVRTDRERHSRSPDFDYVLHSRFLEPQYKERQILKSRYGCPPEFDRRCTCGYRVDEKYDPYPRRKKYFVDCTSSGFTNTSVLEYLPMETEVLVFTGNQIPTLRSNVFGKEGRVPDLKVIDMSNNQIREIDGKAFHHVESVEVLWLAHNNLTNSTLHKHPRVFSNFYSLKDLYLTNTFNDEVWSFSDLALIFEESNLTRLEKLHLGQNELTIITSATAFCHLSSLRHLYIPQNHLTDDVFINVTCLPNLEVIDLRENKIRTITPESNLWKLLDLVNRKGENIRVELLANPFHCDCNLRSFISWLQTEIRNNTDRIRDNENLECASGIPATNANMHLRDIQVTECEALSASQVASNVATGVIWVIVLLSLLVLVTCLYVYRIHILRRVSPLMQAASSGVQYTSIDKNETAEIAHV